MARSSLVPAVEAAELVRFELAGDEVLLDEALPDEGSEGGGPGGRCRGSRGFCRG